MIFLGSKTEQERAPSNGKDRDEYNGNYWQLIAYYKDYPDANIAEKAISMRTSKREFHTTSITGTMRLRTFIKKKIPVPQSSGWTVEIFVSDKFS